MLRKTLPFLLLAIAGSACAASQSGANADSPAWGQALDAYDIAWTTPSTGSADSMPLSGHNLGINAWAEGDRDILLLVGGPDCMDVNGMQVKLGLVRVRFDQPVFTKGFRQTLHLRKSEIVFEGTTADGKPLALTLWGEAGAPVVHARLEAGSPVGATVAYETWSDYQPKAVAGGIQWSRRLPEENPRRLRDMKTQFVEEFAKAVPDPLSGLICGGRIDGAGLVPSDQARGRFNAAIRASCAMKTATPVKTLDLTITTRCRQDKTQAEWDAAVAADAQKAQQGVGEARGRALAWWESFWNRSHIAILPTAGLAPEKDKSWQAGRNYQLSRYQLAANVSGTAPTLFNGGNFACTGNPDGRNWDGCQFMGQNQMLVYWPLQRSGDFDMLKVGCDFYRDRTEINRLRARKFWGVDGVAYCEPFSLFGLDAIGVTKDGRSAPGHLHYHYTSGMVFALMMLAHDAYTGEKNPGYADAAFGLVSYYDHFYQKTLKEKTGQPLDANGKLVIYPSDACEPYHGCTNNLDVLAGLQALCRDLLAAPAGTITQAQRTYVAGFVKRIPDYKITETKGRKYYAAADKNPEWVFRNQNMDFPQMYICFPFSAVSLGRSDMELVKNTWELGPVNATVQHQNQCWYQNGINFARMGETARAAVYTRKKLLHPGYRFPTFYYTTYLSGGSFCHPPDTDHAGTAMTAFQDMIMQTDGDRILLGGAWPAEWSCDFKLHAPKKTTVRGHVAGGKVVVDAVEPESRRKDIKVFDLKQGFGPTPVSEDKPVKTSSNYDGGHMGDKAVDGDPDTRWAGANGQTTGWLEVDLGEPTAVSRAVLIERAYSVTDAFAIEAQQADGSWKTVAEGTTIGGEKELRFPSATATKFRLNLKKMHGPPNLEEFRLFAK